MVHRHKFAGVEVAFVGPPLHEGPLPALFYFALSVEESLTVDPYNQPVVHLQKLPLRIFSINLPAHGPGLKSVDAMDRWAEDFAEGRDPLTPFLDQTAAAILAMREEGVFTELSLMGLSRGGMIAGHIATRVPVKRIVAFAPLTKLSYAPQFDLSHCVEQLCSIPIRFYIGNRDTRVGTSHCFDLVNQLAEEAFKRGMRSPPIEMIVSPSIGHMGHGTSKHTFEAGAEWVAHR